MSLSKTVAAGGILLLAVACSDHLVDPDAATILQPSTEVLNRGARPSTLFQPSDMGCETECITAGEGVYYPVTETATSRQGRSTRTVTHSAYNTETEFVVEVTYAVDGPAQADAIVYIEIDGVEKVFEEVAPGTTVTHRVELPADWLACDEISYAVRQEGLGRPVEFAGSYALIPVCPVVEPVLWNKLGSAEEVTNSEIGPDGALVGAVNFDHDVQFGKGITPNTGYAGSGVDFPTSVVNPERGAVEMWVQFYSDPLWYSHGVYGLVNANHWSHTPLSFTWYNGSAHGTRGFLQFVMKFNAGAGPDIRLDPFEPDLNEPVHLAMVWDREGIDGSGDYMRIYVDGEMAAAGTSNAWGTSNVEGFFRVATTWDRSFSTDRFSVDNLKVWDFAKTDYSDRFDE